MWNICSSGDIVDNFRKIKIPLGNFQILHDSSWAGHSGIFYWDILKLIILEFYSWMCIILSSSVYNYENNFWEIKFSLGNFRLVHDSPWAGQYGLVIAIYWSTAYLTLVAGCEVYAWVLTFKVSYKCTMVFCQSLAWNEWSFSSNF